MTCREFEQASTTDGRRVIAVKDHKTGYKGSAFIGIPAELYSFMEMYRQFMRPRSDQPNFFLKENSCLPFNVSEVNDLLNNRLGTIIGRRVSVGLFRRTVVNRMWEKHPSTRGELARRMSHSEQTAAAFYLLPLGQEGAATMSIQIASEMRGKTHTERRPAPTAAVSRPPDSSSSTGKFLKQCKSPGVFPGYNH